MEKETEFEQPKRKAGRPSILKQLNLTAEQVASLYKASGTEKKTAERLGCTHRTLRKILHSVDVWPESGRYRAVGYTHRPSQMYYWLKEHRGIMPRNVAEVARQSGIKEMTIRKFLQRRKEAAMEHIKALGKLNDLKKVHLVTIKGQRILSDQILQLELDLDQYDLTVTLDCMLRSGVAVKCRLSYVEYSRLFPQKKIDPEYFGLEDQDYATRLEDPRSSSLSGQ